MGSHTVLRTLWLTIQMFKRKKTYIAEWLLTIATLIIWISATLTGNKITKVHLLQQTKRMLVILFYFFII